MTNMGASVSWVGYLGKYPVIIVSAAIHMFLNPEWVDMEPLVV